LLSWYTVTSLCKQFNFKHVPELARGTFEELIDYPTVFEDTIYKLYNLPKIEDNFAEGWVLKPIIPNFMGCGSRVILKGKNPKLQERGHKKQSKPSIELSLEANSLKDELFSFITENRLRNVLSHGHVITQKQFGKLLGLLAKDALDDFYKDFKEPFEGLSKVEQHFIKRQMNKKCSEIIRPHFLDIIDGKIIPFNPNNDNIISANVYVNSDLTVGPEDLLTDSDIDKAVGHLTKIEDDIFKDRERRF
jgi:Rnl2 family RNA ligase